MSTDDDDDTWPDPTRVPALPPFPVGTRLRYKGTHRAYTWRRIDGKQVQFPVIEPGMEVVIDRIENGRRGDGRVLHVDDDGYEIINRTRDGYSVYNSGTGHGRCIYAECAHEWEVIESRHTRARSR